MRVNMYQEESDSTFSHNGRIYNLNRALAIVAHKPVQKVNIDLLDWVLEYTHVDFDRVAAADITAPILVASYQDKLAVVDGAHRLFKAKQQGTKILFCRKITEAELDLLLK